MNKRELLAAALGSSAVLAGCATGSAAPQAASLEGQAVVLIHGAWHGGWCWRDVAQRLRGQGARVFTPTLTGLGERAHLRTPTPNLTTHINDVCAVLEAEELTQVVLCGHSYGGMVITGVADRLKERLKAVLYLDAALPEDGQSMITQNPATWTPEAVEATIATLRGFAPDGEWMAPPPAALFGVPEGGAEAAWLTRRLTAHPLSSWIEPLPLARAGADGLPRTYVLCTDPILPQTAFPAHAARIRAGQAGEGWHVEDLATGHDAMVTRPDAVAALIVDAALRA